MRARSSRNYWKPLIICPHPAMARQIRAAMAELGVDCTSWLEPYPQAAAVAGRAAQNQANLCFLDVATHQEQALALISDMAPFMPVVALNPHSDADLILRCLRRGACEFLSDPSGEQLDGLLDRLARLRDPAQRDKPATVYCVVPGKPGCGAPGRGTQALRCQPCFSGGRQLPDGQRRISAEAEGGFPPGRRGTRLPAYGR